MFKWNALRNLTEIRLAVMAISVMIVMCVFTILWSVDRGFGFTDEGVYILSARYPDEIKEFVSATYIFTGFLFRLANYDLVAFRLLGMLLTVCSVIVFWYGFTKNIVAANLVDNYKNEINLFSLLFFIIGAFIGYQWHFLTPNYYSLASIGLNIFGGSILLALANKNGTDDDCIRRKTALFFVGISIGFETFIKLPIGATLFVILCISLIANRRDSLRKLAQNFVIAVSGIVFWVTFFFIFVRPSEETLRFFMDGWNLYALINTHSPEIRIQTYIIDFKHILVNSFRIFLPCYLIVIGSWIYLKIRGGRNQPVSPRIVLIVFAGAALMSVEPSFNFYESRKAELPDRPFYLFFYSAWIILLVSIYLFNLIPDPRNKIIPTIDRHHFWIVLSVLVMMPIAGALGTSNPLYNVIPFNLVPWFGCIFGILLLMLNMVGGQKNLLFIPVLIIGMFSVNQIIQGITKMPFGLDYSKESGLEWYKQKTIVGESSVIRMGQREKALIDGLRELAYKHGFKPGGDVIAFNYIPGVVYAMGGRSPGHPTFLNGTDMFESYTARALTFSELDRLKKAYVLLNVDVSEVESILNARGVDFPSNYEYLGSVDYLIHQYRLWRPKIDSNQVEPPEG